jgi:hypothetical protein
MFGWTRRFSYKYRDVLKLRLWKMVYLLQVGTVYQLVITISILVSQILGLESILGTEDSWPILLAITVVPGIFQLATLPICPESPKYLLLSKGQEMEAQRGMAVKPQKECGKSSVGADGMLPDCLIGSAVSPTPLLSL